MTWSIIAKINHLSISVRMAGSYQKNSYEKRSGSHFLKYIYDIMHSTCCHQPTPNRQIKLYHFRKPLKMTKLYYKILIKM